MNAEEEIAKLKQESNQHEQALKEEITHWVDKSKSLVTKILLIGGGLTLAYIMARTLLDKNDKPNNNKKNHQSSTFIEIRNFILTELATFLLSIAKEKLLEHLKETKEETNVDTRDTGA